MTPIKKSQEILLAHLGSGIILDQARQKLLLVGTNSFNMGGIPWTKFVAERD